MVVPKRAKKWGPLVCEKKAAGLKCEVVRLFLWDLRSKKLEKKGCWYKGVNG
jgi:hypothetical protein